MKKVYCLISAGLVAGLLSSTAPVFAQGADRAEIIAASPSEERKQRAVFGFLEEYFNALALGQVEKLQVFHPDLTPAQLQTLQNYFSNTIRDLHIRLDNVEVDVGARQAKVSFYRTDQFVDRETSRPVEKSISLTATLARGSRGWQLSGEQQYAFLFGPHSSGNA